MSTDHDHDHNGSNLDLPSADELVTHDRTLTWSGTRVPGSAPPRTAPEPPAAGARSEPAPPEADTGGPAPDTADTTGPPSASASTRSRSPFETTDGEDEDLRAEPLPDQAPHTPAPPSGAPVPLFPPPNQDSGQGTGAGAERPETLPGDQSSRGFLLGEAPPPAPAPAVPPAPETSADLTSERLIRSRTGVPTSPGRRLLYRLSGGKINLGESPKEHRRRALRAAAATHLRGHRRIAVMCIKGGVGKTTTSFVLGSMLADLRGDRVIAVDANTDQGTLAGRMRTETSKTIQDLLRDPGVRGYYDVRGYTSQAPSRLEVLASNEDPAITDAFSAADYRKITQILERFYSICISDCGTGILHDVIRGQGGVLDRTDQLIVVSNTSINGAKKAAETMDWLEENGYKELVRNSISVINMVGEKGHNQIDMPQMMAHFRSRSRAVIQVPVDEHLRTDDRINLELLAPATQEAFLELAALVGAEFSKQSNRQDGTSGPL